MKSIDNARKRSGDNAADYFNRTELIVSLLSLGDTSASLDRA